MYASRLAMPQSFARCWKQFNDFDGGIARARRETRASSAGSPHEWRTARSGLSRLYQRATDSLKQLSRALLRGVEVIERALEVRHDKGPIAQSPAISQTVQSSGKFCAGRLIFA